MEQAAMEQTAMKQTAMELAAMAMRPRTMADKEGSEMPAFGRDREIGGRSLQGSRRSVLRNFLWQLTQ